MGREHSRRRSSAATRSPGQTIKFNVRVHNDSAVSDVITLQGPASPAGFRVRYFKGSTDITSQVTAGTYSLGNLAPGGTGQIRVEVKVRNNNTGGTTDVLVTATSQVPTRQDAVRASVTAG